MSALERQTGTRLTGTDEAFALHRRINRTATDYPRDSSVPALFTATAARAPDALAVVQGERAYTYQELDRLSNGLAHRLLAEGFTPGSTVGVCLARSPELIVALLAVLKCGGAYLPFDVGWPDERLHGLFTDADCRWVLTDRHEQLSRRLGECQVLGVEGELGGSDATPVVDVDGGSLAYVNFTSGSTGRPKGVAVRHRSIARLVLGARFARLDADSRLLQLAPVTFDAATFEIWGALLNGGTCVLYPDGLVRLSRLGRVIDEHRVTVVFLTTALFNAVVDEAPDALDGTETVLMGGELHSIPHVAAALRRYGPGRLVHVYGPTEATTFATHHPVDRLIPDSGLLPIGTPIQNTRLYVTDGDTLCEPGRTGEICLAGDGLSPGYLGMPELTAERFVDRVVDGVTERLYRTGDHGTLLPDGSLVFQGREDDQVKINGFRIELGEVAHHLDRHPEVRRSHVTVSSERGERALVAFVVADGQSVTPTSLRHHLRTRLPAYLVPARIHLCEALPLTPTGKVDGRALLAAHDTHTPPPAAPAAQPVASRD
ncbi:peptide synthetase [Streptomyces sp. ERV7]|uniref:amino acid adenylation domain-containing protein n=1 Tax=Streptomyces sp. ERV7 TaxID=1322334 RepID=UPI0007F49BAF|nr:amino acid adenylation domain-containing protein [Streptomyces sp. ERV7]OAR22859.1 peptide synthetase [Streptomyces sp. ERV7]